VIHRFSLVYRFGCSIVAAAFGGRFFAPFCSRLQRDYVFGF
jgi:hypothetical protein